MLVVALLSMVTSGRICVDMDDYGCAAESWLRTFSPLKNGIPSHDMFSRLFRKLDRRVCRRHCYLLNVKSPSVRG